MSNISSVKILPDTSTTTTGEAHQPNDANLSFQCTGEVSTSTGAASIVIEGHLLKDETANVIWETIDTLSLTLGVTTTSDIGYSTAPYYKVRARVASISGTNAVVRCYMAVDVR